MKPYNLEVSWSADDYATASKALKACKEINPENPIRAAEKMAAVMEALKKIANWEFDIMGDCVAEARAVARRAFLDATDRED